MSGKSLKHSGFTLLEVMMAMAILAIAGMAVMTVAREGLVNSQYLNQKRPAYWLAENVMTDLHLAKKLPGKRWHNQPHEMDGQQWLVRTRSKDTASEKMVALEVEVLQDRNSKVPLARLQSYRLRP